MRRFALACAAFMLVSACQGKPAPIEPTAAASTKPAPVPATEGSIAKRPTLPAIAKRNDATGAANFVLYWVKVSNYAALTGDTDLLREISAPACEGCRRYIELYEKTYAAGGYFKGGDRELKNVEVQSDAAGTYASGRLKAQEGRFKTRAGQPERRSSPESTQVTFLTKFDHGAWTMSDIGLAAL